MAAEDWYEVVWHESGHAVMAWLCGWRLRRVSTLSDRETNGRVTYYPRDIRGKSVWDAAMEEARVDVAGGVACAIRLGLFDTQNMRRWVKRGNPQELPEMMPDAWLDPLLIGVRDDLQAHWTRVEALADELFAHWWLWGKRATVVIEEAQRVALIQAVPLDLVGRVSAS